MKERPKQTEQLIPRRPRLRYIGKTLEILKSETGPDGKEINWKDLHEQVDEWNSALELSEKIRDVVISYLASKLPNLKEKIPSINDLPDDKLLQALANGWFEYIDEEVDDTRRKVLLSVAAHIVRRIETKIYKQIIQDASPEKLQTLGLAENHKALTVELLELCAKADPLFIRFLAHAQETPELPEGANEIAPVGSDKKPHTYIDLFPHETSFIVKRLNTVIETSNMWDQQPGGDVFLEYLKKLSEFFSETDARKAERLRENAEKLYDKTVLSEFPVLVVPPNSDYHKPPLLDPELRVVLRAPDAKQEEERCVSVKNAMIATLDVLDIQRFTEEMQGRTVKSFISIGSFGVGLTLNAVAQEDAMFLNEQIRAYDRDIHKFLPLVDFGRNVFEGFDKKKIEQMSRDGTIMHEFAHIIYNSDTKEAKRLGDESEVTIDEIKAEAVFRGMAGAMIYRGLIEYTPEQFVAITISSALQSMEGADPDSEEFKSAAYMLNGMFETGVATFEDGKIRISDAQKVLEYFTSRAKGLIDAVYRDATMNERVAKKWISENTKPNAVLQEILKIC